MNSHPQSAAANASAVDYRDRRQSPRYLIQLPLLHKAKAPSDSRAGVGWTHNLSETGACVELAERLGPRMPLRLLLRTDRGGIQLEAQVVWGGEPGRLSGGVLHGVKFTNLAPDQVKAIRDLIKSKGQVRNAGVRVPLEVKISCTPTDPKGQPMEGLTGDISRGGLLLLLPEIIAAGSKMSVSLDTPSGPLAVEGTVVWVEPPGGRAAGPPFRHGFQFTTLRWSTSLSLGLFLAEAA